jgi:hypothetical protein
MPQHTYLCTDFDLAVTSVPRFLAGRFDFSRREERVQILAGMEIEFFIHVRPHHGFDPTHLSFGFVQIVRRSRRRSYYRSSDGTHTYLGRRTLWQRDEVDGNPAAPMPLFENLKKFTTNPYYIKFRDVPLFVNESNFQDGGRWLRRTGGYDEFGLYLILYDESSGSLDDVVNLSWRIQWRAWIDISRPVVERNNVHASIQGWNTEDFQDVQNLFQNPPARRANHPASIHENLYNDWNI